MQDISLKLMMLAPTRRCTYRCDDCGINASPESVGDLTAGQMIYHIEQTPALRVKRLGLAGGEPTLHNGLKNVIRYAKNVKDLTGYPNDIVLMSNGHWASSERAARKELEDFGDAGLDFVVVTKGKYHEKFNKKQAEILSKLQKEIQRPQLKVINEGYRIFPLGRAKKLDQFMVDKKPRDCGLLDLFNNNERRVSIYNDGIYACPWRKVKIGEADESLLDVIPRAMNDIVIRRLGKDGVVEALSYMENFGELPRSVDLSLPVCNVCESVFEDKKVLENLTKFMKSSFYSEYL